jgi:hypothetical protein
MTEKRPLCTILFLVAGLILLAAMVTPIVIAREGAWNTGKANQATTP